MKQVNHKLVSKAAAKEKSAKKLRRRPNRTVLAAFIASLSLLIILGLLVNHKNSTKLNTYLTSKSFMAYSGSLKSFLQTDNGIYPKAYSCQSSLQQLWNTPVSPISKKREKLDVELARQLIDLKPKWEQVSKAFPGYGDFFLFKVFPMDHFVYKKYQNAANLMDRSNALVNHTEDYAYYCPGYLYPGIFSFNYLDEYAKNKPIMESVAIINQQMQSLAKIGNDFKDVKTPANWANTRTAYLAFLHQTLDDLTALRNERAINPDGVNMSAKFTADKKLLENVLKISAKSGKKIGPDMGQLSELYKNL